jgi:hypothetical protein
VDSRLLENLRALGVDTDRLPTIPPELQQWIAELSAEDLERIRGDVKELERLGLLPQATRD